MRITKRTRAIRHRETQETEELDLLGSQVGARLRSERAKRRPSRIPQLMGATSPHQYNQHPLAGSCRTAALSGEGGGCVGRSSRLADASTMTPMIGEPTGQCTAQVLVYEWQNDT